MIASRGHEPTRAPVTSRFRADVLRGLGQARKRLPCT